ncbi:SusD/RagB family nutrient-binding outer membrane lipoprotein [Pontibacter sp. Tf4]|uniref:SusD/RagB family nutrient-binding outer membrane lipoprotein n=1 Tax=Pontibacter sp. Tf4 TaxID=2761620 RepID=UPI0016260E12|nr:SusD/RagB family nutrient-binding outer membrane lipoprotein [Pontibacter sp. Tf4]MBB6612830.1 SusD/RagB family nutrient-binding outer membrane lipoprotein [Pontibacter sp. Tf4]
MKKIKLFTLTAMAVSCLATTSCTKDFEELNTNPNAASKTTPSSLLAPALHDVVTRNNNRALRLTNELMQVHVTTLDTDEIHRYVIRPSESDYMWNNWYLQRTNFIDIYNNALLTQQKGYMGIGLILDVWVSSLITDMFGDVPYSDANKGREGKLQPKFDSQETIYKDLFAKLEEANALLAAAETAKETIAEDEKALDPLFYGDLAKWRKFGNSLYLRLLMRASGRPEVDAPAKIREIVESNAAFYPIMANNEESAILRYTTTMPLTSAFADMREYDFNGPHGLSEFFVDNLNAMGDPRLSKWATLYGSVYSGIPSGYVPGNVPERQSYYPKALMNEPLLGNILNYAEVQFILSEAALRGFITADPKTYYDRGVSSAITMWTLEVPAGHLAKPTVAFNEAGDFDAKLEQIMLQKYFTLFFTDFQQWYEYRRTGHPVLPKGPGLQNNGVMPSRFRYPVYVQSLNGANYSAAVAAMGGDDINTKVWWDVD